ncbi:EI24 domain-containing protein [Haloactinomyces albus]|uniref:CysZ protein n=1 Tax=Haloactinomyces albus TaxID=1352928 RepID=A0AAE3ZBG5_9ACTN|nr:EI24 domain-containing protein [Haloactinomyces albus]MDR7300454.1 CysZ protein [Haloactinomyces albus]
MRNFTAGVRTLGTGFGTILRSPKLLLIGAVPALLSTVLLVGALGVLIYFSGDLIGWMTPFAEDWAQAWQRTVRIVVGIALIGAAALVGSLSFIALTLLIGGPFYEHIAEVAEKRWGLNSTGDGAGWLRQTGRGVRDSAKLVLITLAGGLVLFALGFVPVAGQVVTPILAALFGAWVISLEMVGLVFQRGGLRLRERHRVLRRHRARVLGFGLSTYFLCLVPVVQLVVIPSAVVGGTLLAHRLLDPAAAGSQDVQLRA